jgi:cytoplasmic iron level regulating protein YaaA (DUF328/UPF0246 family)
MKILFAPSETKIEGGTYLPIIANHFTLYHDSKALVIESYHNYLQTASIEALRKLFGIKKEEEIKKFQAIDIYHDKTMPAIARYSGVAYDYLDYPTLDAKFQSFLDENLIIFSNLFGPIKASELIPNYKLKQGEKLGDFAIEKYYKQETSKFLDSYFEDELIIDLRAGFYDKFYIPKKPYITMKFIKNGKVVSHWAKAYRGKIVRALAKTQPQSLEEFNEIIFKNLTIKEILTKGARQEYIFDISEH